MTICAKCRHFKQAGAAIWYNQTCGAIVREKAIDPVSGEEGYVTANDLGRSLLADNPHPYCRDINPSGNCPHFAPALRALAN